MKLIPIILLLIFFSGCVQNVGNETEETNNNEGTETQNTFLYRDTAIALCEEICRDFVSEGKYMENGPCLSDNNAKWNVTDWVCDVAHSPRQGRDELSENQCLLYRVGRAQHFVEVDLNCNLIRSY